MESLHGSKPVVCFEVEKVIGVSSCGNVRSYQVQWAPAWVSSLHLVGCEHLIHEFLQQASDEGEDGAATQPTCNTNEFSSLNSSETLYNNSSEVILQLEDNTMPEGDEVADICIKDVHSRAPNQFERSYILSGASDGRDPTPIESSQECSTDIVHVKVEEEDIDGAGHLLSGISDKPILAPQETDSDEGDSSSLVAFVSTMDAPLLWNTSDEGDGISENSRKDEMMIPTLLRQRSGKTRKVKITNSSFKDPRFICTICKRQCLSRSHLTIHTRSHTGHKPYACTHCDKAFAKKGNLKDHLRTHTGLKPFQCNVCQKAFAQRSNLKTHQQTHLRSYNCEECGKTFSQYAVFKKHLQTHKL